MLTKTLLAIVTFGHAVLAAPTQRGNINAQVCEPAWEANPNTHANTNNFISRRDEQNNDSIHKWYMEQIKKAAAKEAADQKKTSDKAAKKEAEEVRL
ncbi:hypothetical protein PspLS_03084 [Pyricularia sp. CBS 133598]|nr:hypothetical protein PspLS_03084 [Pyricularia sp. CBS 133598]